MEGEAITYNDYFNESSDAGSYIQVYPPLSPSPPPLPLVPHTSHDHLSAELTRACLPQSEEESDYVDSDFMTDDDDDDGDDDEGEKAVPSPPPHTSPAPSHRKMPARD